ncbi:MAG: sigma-70 family RNA polymerase sigma factor [Actinoplanes sp.]
MSEQDLLAARFEADRAHLRAVAQRILGSAHEAEDAVQEAWVRLSRADTTEVGNLTGWLTTVVSRVCLDMLRSRAARREDPAEQPPEPATGETDDPEREALVADAIGPALLLVLDTLGPAERLAFVLHDMFAVPFPEIATIVGCSPVAARQLASRARRRVQGLRESDAEDDVSRRQTVVDAFLAAAREGDFAGLLALLDPSVVLRADAAAAQMGSTALVRGAQGVAETFSGKARAARPVLIDGVPGLVWSLRGVPKVVFSFTIDAGGLVTGIDLIADPDTIAAMAIVSVGRAR